MQEDYGPITAASLTEGLKKENQRAVHSETLWWELQRAQREQMASSLNDTKLIEKCLV